MSRKRKNYRSEFKAKIALEAIKGFTSINEIAKEYKVLYLFKSLSVLKIFENS